ncbi:MAG: hypothetical protein P4L67_01785 [Candidatus Pacebacteria bacterium]|nr:hypothetical protein [Candidatus Paceibacterota bacterium]
MKPKKILKKIREGRGPSDEFRHELERSLRVYMKDNPPLPDAELAAGGRVPASGAWKFGKGVAAALATVLILCAGAVGTVFAAQQALPGDALYGIKLAADQLSVDITRSPAVRVNVANRRIDEIAQALAAPSANTGRVQEDIQSALQQYRSVLQEGAHEGTNPAPVSSSPVVTAASSSVTSSSSSLFPSAWKAREDNEGSREENIVQPSHTTATSSSYRNGDDRSDNGEEQNGSNVVPVAAPTSTAGVVAGTSTTDRAVYPQKEEQEQERENKNTAIELPTTTTASASTTSPSSTWRADGDKSKEDHTGNYANDDDDMDMKIHSSSTSESD